MGRVLTELTDHERAEAMARFQVVRPFLAPSALNTSLALRQAIWRKDDPRWHICGIPQTFYTDCGSDFTSQHLEQVSADLHMGLTHSIPGEPRGRGRIERFFQTVQHMLRVRATGLCASPGSCAWATAAHAG